MHIMEMVQLKASDADNHVVPVILSMKPENFFSQALVTYTQRGEDIGDGHTGNV